MRCENCGHEVDETYDFSVSTDFKSVDKVDELKLCAVCATTAMRGITTVLNIMRGRP